MSLQTKVWISQQKRFPYLFVWAALMLERRLSTFLWLRHGKTCSNLLTKIIESKFINEITEEWGGGDTHYTTASYAPDNMTSLLFYPNPL